MKKLVIPMISSFVFLCVSCGEAQKDSKESKSENGKKSTSVKTEKASEKSDKGENIVDPDEFSKAFSKKMGSDGGPDNNKKELSEDKSKFFKEGALVKNRFSNQDFEKNKVPFSSLASEISSSKKYSWLPNFDHSATALVNLPEAVLSDDFSLISIIDNVNSGKGFKSSLIVSINTYNFNIQNIHYFKGRLFTGLRFVPDTTKVIAWEESQEEEGKGVFHLIDLKNGSVLSSSKQVKSQSVDFEINGDGKDLIAKSLMKNKKIFIFDIDDLNELPKVVESDQEDGNIAISPNNKLFAIVGKSRIEIYKISDKMKLKEAENPLGKVPDDFIFLDGDNSFALLSYRNPFYLVIDGDPKKICDLSGRELFYRKDNKSIVFEESKYKAVSILDINTLKKIDTFSPEKLRPRTYGSALLISYLPHLKKYMVLDKKGNLALYYRPGRRWRKELIFPPEK